MQKGSQLRQGKGCVSILSNNGSIKLQWTFQGQRFTLSPGLKHDQVGLKTCKGIVHQIEMDILSGNFDPSLAKYRPVKPVPEAKGRKIPRSSYTYAHELYKAYLEANSFRKRTITWHYQPVLRMLEKDKPKIQEISSWMQSITHLKPRSWNDRLCYLKKGIKWALTEGLISEDYGILSLSNRTVSQIPDPTRKPFTTKEIHLILDAIKSNKFVKKSSRYPHSHYYGYIAFQIYTGCRPAETIALQWQHVDFEKREIEISTALARGENGSTSSKHRIRKETKTGSVRFLPMNDELFNLLSNQYSGQGKEDLVFPSPTGVCIDDRNVLRRVWKPILEALGIPYRVPYACRHSMASRAIEQGIPLTGIAYLLGHQDTSMVVKHYGHMINRPNLPNL